MLYLGLGAAAVAAAAASLATAEVEDPAAASCPTLELGALRTQRPLSAANHSPPTL